MKHTTVIFRFLVFYARATLFVCETLTFDVSMLCMQEICMCKSLPLLFSVLHLFAVLVQNRC